MTVPSAGGCPAHSSFKGNPMSFIKSLLSSSFVQSFATREVRHLATAAAGALGAWLATKGGDPTSATNVGTAVGALILAVFGYGLSWLNGQNAETRVQVAAATGTVISGKTANGLMQQGGDPAGAADLAKLAVAHADASAPTTKAALLADLAAGGPK
jgi:hypothetical protein